MNFEENPNYLTPYEFEKYFPDLKLGNLNPSVLKEDLPKKGRVIDYKKLVVIVKDKIFKVDKNFNILGYISFDDNTGNPVKIMKNNNLIIDTVYVEKEYRNQGIAKFLMAYIRKMGKTIDHSRNLTAAGRQFAYKDMLNLSLKKRNLKIPFDVIKFYQGKLKRLNGFIMNSRQNLEYSKKKFEYLIKNQLYLNNRCSQKDVKDFFTKFMNEKKILKKHKLEFAVYLKDYCKKLKKY